MIIRYRNGMFVEAVILSLTGSKMRVALKDGDDVAEFRVVKDTWISEDGEPVTFDFTLSILAAAGIVPPADLAAGPAASEVPFPSLFDFPTTSARPN